MVNMNGEYLLIGGMQRMRTDQFVVVARVPFLVFFVTAAFVLCGVYECLRAVVMLLRWVLAMCGVDVRSI